MNEILNQIILRLTEPLASREDAAMLGRMGFLEWLVSVPEDGNFRQQAMLAYERAAPLKMAVPAIHVLCDLLLEAASKPVETNAHPERQATRIARRRGARRRRSLH